MILDSNDDENFEKRYVRDLLAASLEREELLKAEVDKLNQMISELSEKLGRAQNPSDSAVSKDEK